MPAKDIIPAVRIITSDAVATRLLHPNQIPGMPPQNRADCDCKQTRSASAVAAGNRDTIGDHDQPGHWRTNSYFVGA